MPNQINRDIYVLSSKVKDPIDYVRLTNDIPIVFTFRDYDIPSGSTAHVYVQKPSGKAVYDTAKISGNVVTVTVTDQMFAELGVSDLQIRITQGDEKLVSFSQPVRVHPNYTEGDAQQSQNDGGFFDDAEQAVENANTAAENANSAADAANAAAEAVEGAVSGVINDNQVSESTTYSSQKLGNFSQLLTTAKNTFVAAINELVLKIGDLKELATTEKTDIVSAINEIEGDKLDKENIANNLTTTQEGYALDARQGKILDDKITQTNSDLADSKKWKLHTSKSGGTTFNLPSSYNELLVYTRLSAGAAGATWATTLPSGITASLYVREGCDDDKAIWKIDQAAGTAYLMSCETNGTSQISNATTYLYYR